MPGSQGDRLAEYGLSPVITTSDRIATGVFSVPSAIPEEAY